MDQLVVIESNRLDFRYPYLHIVMHLVKIESQQPLNAGNLGHNSTKQTAGVEAEAEANT